MFFACTSVCVKLLPSGTDPFFISFVRFIIGALLSLAALRAARLPLRVIGPFPWVMRGVIGSASMILVYLSIRMTSSGRAILLNDTYPVFVVLFGVLLFGKRVRPALIAPLFVCFCGVLLVLFDASPYPPEGNIIGLASGMLGGIAVHFIQISLRNNSSFIVYLSACVFGAAATSFSVSRIPDFGAASWCIVCAVGVFAFAGQILMTKGYRYISATGGSITGLAEVPLTVCASALVIGEHITARFVAGAAVIVSGLVLNFILARRD